MNQKLKIASWNINSVRARTAIVERLIDGFQRRFGLDVTALKEDELAATRQLVADRYGTSAWTRDLP